MSRGHSGQPPLTTAELVAELSRVMDDIEQAMRRSGNWEGVPPSPERLSSETPFCHDTLEFVQWLQWIFLPRFRALLDSGAELPAACAIAPAAEIAFADRAAVDAAAICTLLVEFDHLLTTRTRHTERD